MRFIRSIGTFALGSAVVFSVGGCPLDYSGLFPPLATAQNFDVSRYTGVWYEIAKYPVVFENGCEGVTAEYTLRDDGSVRVFNTCRNPDGSVKSTIDGTAQVLNADEPAKLSVSFSVAPFGAPYWVLEVGENYEYAVVGEPSRNTFWILSRTPTLDDATLQSVIAKMPEWGYDAGRLEYMEQSGNF